MKKTVIRRKMNFSLLNFFIRVLFLFPVIIYPCSSFGQKIVPTPQDLFTEANEYMLAGEYQEALPVLLNLHAKGYTGAGTSYKIGECYLNGKSQKTRAIPYLKAASQNISASYAGSAPDETIAPIKTLLYLGIAYRLNNDFEKAIGSFGDYLNALPKDDTAGRSLVEFHISRCQNAKELMAAPARFTCDTLPDLINTVNSNFNPVITPDEKQLYYMDQLKFYDALMHSARMDTAWQPPENLTPAVRSDGDHLVTGISADGSLMLLSLYDVYQAGEIFSSESRNGEWGEVQKLNSNINTRFNETHASLSPDGKTLYFTSDRPGGMGGMDIYISRRTSQGDWGRAVNAGPLINTPFNEETPFISRDGKTLFFSSQGHYNMGGYDVFMCSADEKDGWLPPFNIGYPMNTTDDDLFFVPVKSDKIAYQSRFPAKSSQSEIVRYQILSFGNPARFTILGKVNVQGDPETKLLVTIDNPGNNPISSSLNADGSFRQKITSGSNTLTITDNGKELWRKNIDIPPYFPQDVLVIQADVKVITVPDTDTLVVSDIRFDFNESDPEDRGMKYMEELVRILKAFPEVKLAVDGYADSRGNEDYNLKLSMARARAVEGYLNQLGDFSQRIAVNAFGENDPVARNTTPGGLDSPEGRMFNRRVELIFSHVPANLIIIRQNDIPAELRLKK
jgi:outer membrane protein OmpA-like peptidoglycan-associated protein/tetratricopeptide (TPR) repeat protein